MAVVSEQIPRVKVGQVSVPVLTPTTVTFVTAFENVPEVVISASNLIRTTDIMLTVSGITVSQFIVEQDNEIGNVITMTWIATDAGNI